MVTKDINGRSVEYYIGLLNELRKLPTEAEWFEFKHNNIDSEEIGEYCSALVNSALLSGKTMAYLIWGIDDKSHDIIGTTFKPEQAKVGNEALDNWLIRLLSPKIDFHFLSFTVQKKPVVILELSTETNHPVQFKNRKYIRIQYC